MGLSSLEYYIKIAYCVCVPIGAFKRQNELI